jgi:hypothetical protein
MSVLNFIPNMWAGGILANLNKAQVFAQPGVVNRDYEGAIRNAGDSVKITAIGPVALRSYVRNTDMTGPDALTDALATLTVDQPYYFNFAIDDVDQRQASANLMAGAVVEAAYAISNSEDVYVAGLYAQAGTAIASSGSPKTDLGTAGKPWEYLATLKQNLDEQNVPQDGRWVVIPPWYLKLLMLDSKFNASPATDITGNTIRNGDVGRRVLGFNVLMSNNVQIPTGTVYAIMAGWTGAITFAEQILELKAYSPEKRMADALKGVVVYGAKVVRPNALTVGYLQKA